jgi:hypothetical protein
LGAFRGRVSAHYNLLLIGKRLSSGAFLAQSAKNRAFRFKSSDLLMQILWAFRYNPLRGGNSASGHTAERLNLTHKSGDDYTIPQRKIYREVEKVKLNKNFLDFAGHWFFDD